MDIPLLSKEDIEKENINKEDIGEEDKDIREQIIEFLKSKGYKHVPIGQAFTDETSDFFIKDDHSVEVILSDDVPEELLEQMENVEQ